MTKTLVHAQKRRGKIVKKKLQTILKKLYALLNEIDGDNITNDAENVCQCLATAKAAIEDAEENYTTYI